MVRNTAIAKKTGLQSVSAIIAMAETHHANNAVDARRTALFGRVARLDDRVPTCCMLRFAIEVRSGMPPSPSWKRPRAALVTRGSNLPCTPTYLSRSAGMLLLDVVMVFRRNVPRGARVFDDDF